MFSYFKNKDIVRKVFFTLIIVAAFRLIATIPIPGIPQDGLQALLDSSSFFQSISTLSGGLLRSIGILTIGLGPYINASYIFQILSIAIPQVKELYQGGPVERKMLTLYTRLLSVPLAVIQSIVIYTVLVNLNLPTLAGFDPSQLEITSMIVLFTFGSILAMWFGELITEYGMGGGTSVIILAGILVSVPGQLVRSVDSIGVRFLGTKVFNLLPFFKIEGTSEAFTKFALMISIILGSLILAIVISLAIRKIRLIYARRVRPTGIGGFVNYIPLSINPAGVMPVIFAMSILDLPRIAAQFLSGQTQNETVIKVSASVLSFYNNQGSYNFLLMGITLAFTFFSAYMVFKPEEVAENINKQGGFIEGVRPGKATQRYLNTALWSTTFFGAVILAVLTVVPSVLSNVYELPRQAISGTGAMIMAGVIMDMVRQVQAMKLMDQDKKDYF